MNKKLTLNKVGNGKILKYREANWPEELVYVNFLITI